jgi:hypothetical protein
MKTKMLSILTAALALGWSAAASADRGHDRHWDRHDHRHWHADRRDWNRYYVPPRIVRERIIVERPVYVAPRAPVYYEYPPVRHYPGIVVNVDIPPLVIPLR